MFRPMRRKNQELSNDECIKLLKMTKRASIALIGDDDYPYSLPINYYYDEETNVIYFHSAKEGHKVDAIKKNNKISFSIIGEEKLDEGNYFYFVKSVIIFGKAEIVLNEDDRFKFLKIFGMKYFPSEEYTLEELKNSMARALLIKINIEHMTGKLVHEK